MSPGDDQAIYRARIYGTYVTGRSDALAPQTLQGLAPRMPYLRWLVRTCMPADRAAAILDIGCGHGAILHALQQAGYHQVRGVDGSAEQVQAAARLGIGGVVQGDLMQTLHETTDASADVVIAFDVIEHFTRAEVIPLVDEVQRVLKPGGRWVIHVPNGESPFSNRVRFGDYTHEEAFTRTSLGQLLLASGFLRVNAYEDRPIAHGFTSSVRAALWQLIRATMLFYIAVETGSFDRRAVFSQNLLAVAWKGD